MIEVPLLRQAKDRRRALSSATLLHICNNPFFQDTYNNMPFQSWEIRPQGANCIIFTLIAATVELEITLKVRD